MGKDIPLTKFAQEVLAETNRMFPDANEFQDYCDPAGNQASDKGEGETSVKVLGELLGHMPNFRKSLIMEGVEMIRHRMRTLVAGKPLIRIDASCETLIEGLEGGVHYSEKYQDKIEKDGHYEHLHDALRYGIIGISSFGEGDVFEIYKNNSTWEPRNATTGY